MIRKRSRGHKHSLQRGCYALTARAPWKLCPFPPPHPFSQDREWCESHTLHGNSCIPFKVTAGSRGGAGRAEMAGRTCCLPFNTSLASRPWLISVGFLLSPTYPHFRLCEGLGLQQNCPGFCGKAGPLGGGKADRLENSAEEEGSVIREYIKPRGFQSLSAKHLFINIKGKCFWLLSKHYDEMGKCVMITSSAQLRTSPVWKASTSDVCVLSCAPVIGNENINLRGTIKAKFTASSQC